jgi:hypothetical protein
MTKSIFVLEKLHLPTNYRQLVGVYETKLLADQAAVACLELTEPPAWHTTISILPLNGIVD